MGSGIIAPSPSMFIFELLQILLVPGLIIGVIIYFLRRRNTGTKKDKERNRFAHQDLISELLMLLSVFFFGSLMLAVNRQMGAVIEWQWIVCLVTIVGFVLSYFFSLRFTLFFSMIGLLVWWLAQGSVWSEAPSLVFSPQNKMALPGSEFNIMPVPAFIKIKDVVLLSGFLLVAMLYYGLSLIHGTILRQKRFSSLYAIVGMIVTTGVLFLLSHENSVESFAAMTRGLPVFASWQLTIVFFLFAAGVFGTLILAAYRKLADEREIGFLFAMTLLIFVLAFIPEQQSYTSDTYLGGYQSGLRGTGFLFALLFNGVLFVELLAILFSGYVRKEVWRINLGAVLLFIFIVVKYFDWFFTFLDKSIFFISAGILLFGVGYFMERGRRLIVTAVKEKEST